MTRHVLALRFGGEATGEVAAGQHHRDGELALVRRVLARAGARVKLRAAVATMSELRRLLTAGCDALHFTGHGVRSRVFPRRASRKATYATRPRKAT